MKIVINASNLTIGGGEIIGLGVIEALYHHDKGNDFHVLVSAQGNYLDFKSVHNIHIHLIPSFYTNNLAGRLLRMFYLLYCVYKLNPDAIFSMGNYAIPSTRKQLVLLHWPYIVYPDSAIWKQMNFITRLKRKIRAFLVRQKLRFATALTVQTPLMKDRVLKHLDFKRDIYVVESATALNIKAPDLKKSNAINRMKQAREQYPSHKFLLFVSVYYSHKNMAILIPLARQIKENNDSFKLFISLNPNQNKATKELLDQIKQEHLDQIIINLESIPRKDLNEIYRYSDGFIMPTLLESYGITYIEAMLSEIPIFTSDLDFAHQTCGEAAFYFNPLDYRSIYKTLIEAHRSPDLIAKKIILGKERTSVSLTWIEITENYMTILKNL